MQGNNQQVAFQGLFDISRTQTAKQTPTGSMPVLGHEYRILQLDTSRLQQAERATEESQTACSVLDR